MSKRARFIVNPTSRTVPPPDRLATAPAWLALHGWHCDTHWTRSAAHGEELAREAAAEGYDAVVAVGGDGTVNQVVNGIAGTPTALAVIPGGTANVWAGEVGGPRHPGSVAALLERGERRQIDLGIAGGRYFLLMASLGIDSIVADLTHRLVKERLGRMAYIVHGIQEATRYRAVRAVIEVEGERIEMPLLLALIGNTRSYGGLIEISHHASATDGLLDLVAYRGDGLAGLATRLLATVARVHPRTFGTVYRHATAIAVETDPPVPVQADGDVIGATPMRFGVAPRALTVIVPAGSRVKVIND
jgi:diacylglycerol kinase (ATP)